MQVRVKTFESSGCIEEMEVLPRVGDTLEYRYEAYRVDSVTFHINGPLPAITLVVSHLEELAGWDPGEGEAAQERNPRD